jgi:WD40 repeat protein
LEAWDWRNAKPLWGIPDPSGERCSPYTNWYHGQTQTGRISISPAGDYLATYVTSSANAVRLYHLATGELVTIFTGHTAAITGVAFSPDGTNVAASSLDGTILIWPVP